MMAGGQTGNGKPAREREQDDFYPTPAEAVDALLRAEDVQIPRHIWEPACGDGAICKVLAGRNFQIDATDLFDRGYGCAGINFLTTKYRLSNAIITNPPFKLAGPFIEHAMNALEISYMALLLKSTFYHAAARLPLFKRFPPAVIYPLTWRLDFMDLGAPTMECAWFVWDSARAGNSTAYVPLRHPTAGVQEVLL